MNKYLKIILDPIKYSKKMFSIFFVMEAFDGFQSVFVVVLMSYIITALENKSLEDLYFWITVFVIISIFKIFNSLFSDSIHSNLANDITLGLAKEYFKKFIKLDNTKVESFGTGKMHNIIFKGTEEIKNILKLSLSIIVELIAIIYIFILISVKVPNIYYFIGFSLLFIIVILLFGKGLQKIVNIRKRAKENYVEIDQKRVKILMSKFEILQNNQIENELNKIEKIYKQDRKLWYYGNLKKNLWQTGSEVILEGFYVIIFLVIGTGIISGYYDIATFALMIWMLQILGKYARQIRAYMRDISRSFIDVEKLIDVFENTPTYKDDSKLSKFKYQEGNIEFNNINFGYEKRILVLNKFNLKIKGGKRYAFVGESGGGKSTIVKLVTGYINPNKGDIIIDNQKLSEVQLKSFYKNIGYLSQEPSVFDGSIIENLTYALNYEPTKDQLEEVIKLSKCEYIYELKNKLKTQIGEKGVRLSGGQKQRLAIAKIMLKNPKIIILDEPTSALDSFNEEQISIALHNLFKNKTVIVVAHRLQTVKHSDMIFYIDNGKIIEKGNHDELLKLKGKYYKMIELQSGF